MTNKSHLFQYMSFCSAQVSLEVMILLLEKKKEKQGNHENLLLFLFFWRKIGGLYKCKDT